MKTSKKHINKNGFLIPEDYFKEFESKNSYEFFDSNSNSKHGFTTPNNYFETLEATTIENITTSKRTSKIVSLFSKQRILYYSGIAAILVLSIMIYTSKAHTLDFTHITNTDVQEYIHNDEIVLSDFEIATLLEEETIHLLEEEHMNENELIEYLIDESLDEDVILIQ